MKTPIRFLSASVATAVALLAIAGAHPARGADEKIDAGPPPTPEETKAIEELGKHGVFAGPIAIGINWRGVNFRAADKPDAALYSQLKSIPSIVELDLAGAHFTPADLANISGLKDLKKLNLSSSNVTDEGLAALEKMEKLQWLNLFSTGITDAGLDHLAGIKTLKRLYLFETKVSDAGVDKLKAALPELKVDRGWDKNPPVVANPPPEVKKPEAPPAAPAPKPEEKKPEPPPAPKPEEKKGDAKPAPPAAASTPAAPAPAAPAPAVPPTARTEAPAKPAEPTAK